MLHLKKIIDLSTADEPLVNDNKRDKMESIPSNTKNDVCINSSSENNIVAKDIYLCN